MQREKMEYKQFRHHYNAMQSGRGREMEGRRKKKCEQEWTDDMGGGKNKEADIQGHKVWEVVVRLAYLPLCVSLAAA